ncbi:hypothetical protein ROV96_19390 [Stenotrophomonas pavanii]|uniref:hypothetical protein n=1 Tax=Stenotrophomonas pavanii TaxID=487698 RepID=UPI0028943E8E|nr:hypothetical protein [Stenotrophomonas pavanii]MDT3457385.1 hypothetical protein [Stenotrophomonas pavanii]MDT3466103.1 hypothetical protein [Stenotrophomonas pavanii]
MNSEEVKTFAEAIAQTSGAAVRAVGDLALALSKQPGIDGPKLIADFLKLLPEDPAQQGHGAAMLDGLKSYLSPENP